jgi:hypothetical protein
VDLDEENSLLCNLKAYGIAPVLLKRQCPWIHSFELSSTVNAKPFVPSRGDPYKWHELVETVRLQLEQGVN